MMLARRCGVDGAHIDKERARAWRPFEQTSRAEEDVLHLWYVGNRSDKDVPVISKFGRTSANGRAEAGQFVGRGRVTVRNNRQIVSGDEKALSHRQAHRAQANQSDSLVHIRLLVESMVGTPVTKQRPGAMVTVPASPSRAEAVGSAARLKGFAP